MKSNFQAQLRHDRRYLGCNLEKCKSESYFQNFWRSFGAKSNRGRFDNIEGIFSSYGFSVS